MVLKIECLPFNLVMLTQESIIVNAPNTLSGMILGVRQGTSCVNKKPIYGSVLAYWWVIQDSNLSPPQRQCGALAK